MSAFFFEKLVRRLRHRALCGRGLTAVLHAEREHHLALPEGDGVDERGLDLYHISVSLL